MSIIKNASYQFINLLGSKLFIFIFIMFFTRKVGVEQFGLYSYIITYCGLWDVFMDFGMQIYITRKISIKGPKDKIIDLDQDLLFKLLVVLMGFSLAIVIAKFIIGSANELLLISIAVGSYAINSINSFFYAILRGLGQLKVEAVTSFLNKLIYILLGFMLLLNNYGVKGVYISLLLSSLLSFIIVQIYLIYNYKLRLAFEIDNILNKAIKLFKSTIVLFSINIFTMIYFKIDVLMINQYMGEYAVGVYSAAYRLMENFQIIPSAIITALFPALTRAVQGNEHDLKLKYFINVFLFLWNIGLVVVSTGWLYSKQAILIVFGENYNESIWPFKYLLIALLIMYLNYIMTHVVIAEYNEKKYSIFVLICALINISLNAVLIPVFGVTGAIIATIFTEITLFILIALTIKEYMAALNYKQIISSSGIIIILFIATIQLGFIQWTLSLGLWLIGISVFSYHYIFKQINMFRKGIDYENSF